MNIQKGELCVKGFLAQEFCHNIWGLVGGIFGRGTKGLGGSGGAGGIQARGEWTEPLGLDKMC
jgi:hypothetical protein